MLIFHTLSLVDEQSEGVREATVGRNQFWQHAIGIKGVEGGENNSKLISVFSSGIR